MMRYLTIVAFIIAANITFAGSIVTQRVVNVRGFVNGSTTISLSGQMTESAMDNLVRGYGVAVYNSLDNYLVFPTLLQKTKTGYGKKFNTKNVSVSAKNGKFQWTEKDVTEYFTFAVGREKIKPKKATFKSSGTVETSDLAKLDTKKLTVYDYWCSEQGLGRLASLSCTPERKGNNFKYSKKEQDLQVKFSANSNGKVSAYYKLQPTVASPAFIDNEYVFTNQYDYSLVIVGEGDVFADFCGPDQVEFSVTENIGKFRFFAYDGIRVTNDYMILELMNDTEVAAVFGNYDLALSIVGDGAASFEFTGQDEVEIKALDGSVPFRYFVVNGEKVTGSTIALSLQEDTAVEAVFGNYDFATEVVGDGSVDFEFTGPDLVEVRVPEGSKFFRYFVVNGQKRTEATLLLSLQEDTVVEAVFGTYDLTVEIIGNGSVDVEFTGPDVAKVKVVDGDAPFRYFTVNGKNNTNKNMSLALEEDTLVEAVFGTYSFSTEIVGEGAIDYEFLGQDLVEVRVNKNNRYFRYFTVNGEARGNTKTLLLDLEEDTVVEAVFGTYAFSLVCIGTSFGSASYEFIGQDEVEIKVSEGGALFRYFNVNGKRYADSSIRLSLEEDTDVSGVFGMYAFSADVVGDGSLDYEFLDHDRVEVRVPEDSSLFRYFTVNGKTRTEKTIHFYLQEDTEVKAVFGIYAFSTEVVGEGVIDCEFLGPDLVEVTVNKESSNFRYFTVNGEARRNITTLLLYLEEDTVVEGVFGTYSFNFDIVGGGSADFEFKGPDEVEIKVPEDSGLFRYFTVNLIPFTNRSLTLYLKRDTRVKVFFGTYNFSVDIVGDGTLDYKFTDRDIVEVKVPDDAERFRYLIVNGEKRLVRSMVINLTEDTAVSAVFGKYDCETVVVGSGHVESKFTGIDEVTLSAISEEDVFSCFEWNGCVTNLTPVSIQLVADTVVTATFSAANYLVVDISGGTSAQKWPYRITTDKPDVENDNCRGEELWLRYVPPGSYMMGSPKNENGRGTREDQHKVTISKGFYIGVFEVTQKQYKLITDTSYPNNKDTYPCCKVNFEMLRGKGVGAGWPEHDRVNSSSVVGVIRAKTGLRFDIPTEAQWEYACRAGTTTAYNSGNNMFDKNFNLKEICNYLSSETLKVGSLKPNKWGLYDMHGNVWEWCLDWYVDNLGFDSAVDPKGPETGEMRVLRGGYYRSDWNECRSAYRSYSEPDNSFYADPYPRFGFRFIVNED